jgi:hypothetical protein
MANKNRKERRNLVKELGKECKKTRRMNENCT